MQYSAMSYDGYDICVKIWGERSVGNVNFCLTSEKQNDCRQVNIHIERRWDVRAGTTA